MILLGLCVTIMMASAVNAQDAEPPVIRDVVIQVAEPLPEAIRQQVDAILTPLIDQPVTEGQVAELEATLQALGWFRRVEVTTETVNGGVRLLVALAVNPVVQQMEFEGNTVLSDETLREVVQTQPGEILNLNRVREDALAIQEAYADQGYTLVEVTDLNVTPEGTLEFIITEPTISEIRIQGNERTEADVIFRALEVEVGDVYNVNDIRQSLTNLQRLGVFDEVTAVPEPGAVPGSVLLVINVRERRTGFVAFGGTYSDVGGFSGYVDFSEANLFGEAQRVSLRVQFGAREVYQLSYFNPWIASDGTNLLVNVYDREDLHQAEFGGEIFDYVEERTGGNITVGRPISPVTTLYGTLRIDSLSARPEEGETVPAIILQSADVRSLGLSAIRDTRINLGFPVRGSYSAARVEQAGILGGENFSKLSGEVSRYWPVRRARPVEEGREPGLPWVLASRLLAGTSFNAPPLLDQFFLGGADNLRGFPEDRFPGENIVVLNTELRVPVTESLYGVAFVDIGDAWGGVFAEQFGDPNFELHLGYGLGVRVQTAIGQLRLDYGISDDGDNEFHFGIGPTF
jgi:outer membrane protein insertion porin family